MDPDDLDAAIARLQEIAGEDRGRVSWRARQALADIERAVAHFNGGGEASGLPPMAVNQPRRPRRAV